MADADLLMLASFAAPLAALLLRWAVSGNRYARERWTFVAAYYGLFAVYGAFIWLGEFGDAPMFVFVMLGPVAALVLLATPAGTPEPPREARGFPVHVFNEPPLATKETPVDPHGSSR